MGRTCGSASARATSRSASAPACSRPPSRGFGSAKLCTCGARGAPARTACAGRLRGRASGRCGLAPPRASAGRVWRSTVRPGRPSTARAGGRPPRAPRPRGAAAPRTPPPRAPRLRAPRAGLEHGRGRRLAALRAAPAMPRSCLHTACGCVHCSAVGATSTGWHHACCPRHAVHAGGGLTLRDQPRRQGLIHDQVARRRPEARRQRRGGGCQRRGALAQALHVRRGLGALPLCRRRRARAGRRPRLLGLHARPCFRSRGRGSAGAAPAACCGGVRGAAACARARAPAWGRPARLVRPGRLPPHSRLARPRAARLQQGPPAPARWPVRRRGRRTL